MAGFMGKSSRRILLVSFLAIGASFFFISSCETDNIIVNLALKKDGKTYVFSKLGTFITKTKLGKNESPSVFPFLRIFNDDGLFVSPDNLEDIVNAIGGNNDMFPFPEQSYDGYFTAPKESLFNSEYVNKSTAVVGQQIRQTTVTLVQLNNSDTFEIVYEYNASAGEYMAVKNCVMKSFWITESIYPGESTTSSEDFLMVNLNDIVNFYDSNIKLELNNAEQLLYIITD